MNLWLYQNRQLKLEDLYKAKEYLTYFIKFAQKIEDKDINHYSSLPQLYEKVRPFMENPNQASSHSEEVRIAKEGAEKVYEDDSWLIIIPRTEEAAKYYGKNTQWCTAADNNNQFDNYNNQGPLFINIDKTSNEKYQFHFESDQFMDETDTQIEAPIIENIPMPNGALRWYEANVEQWSKLVEQRIEFWLKDDVQLYLCKKPDDNWYIEYNGEVICKDVGDADYFGDMIYEELESRGWSDIPTVRKTYYLLTMTYHYKSRSSGGGYYTYDVQNIGEYASIKELTEDWDSESYKIFKCYTLDDKIKVVGQNDFHFNTFDASELDDIFMYGDVIFYRFVDDEYIIQNMDDDEFNTVQIPERFEGQLNYDEWPYMYWIYTDNGHEMKINMETFDYRYLNNENYDPNEEF